MIRALVPIGGLARRDSSRAMRMPRFAVFLAVLVSSVGLLVLAAWPDATFASAEHVWDTAGLIPLVVCIGFGGVAAVVVCGYAATSIRGERDHDTYDLVRMSLLTPGGILTGKLLSIFGLFIIMLCAVLPCVATVYFLVGFEWQLVVLQFITIAAAGFACLAGGLLCSVIAETTPRAVIGSYLLALVLQGGYLLPIQYALVIRYDVLGYTQPPPYAVQALYEISFAVTPVVNLIGSVQSTRLFNTTHFGYCIAFQLIVAFACLLTAWLLLRRRPRDPLGLGKAKQPAKKRPPNRDAAPSRTFPDRRNPILVRELRALAFTAFRTRARVLVAVSIFAALFLLTGTLTYLFLMIPTTDYGEAEAFLIEWVGAWFIVAGLVAPSTTSIMWSRDAETGTKDLIDMTAMTPMDVLCGKAGACFVFTLCAVGLFILATSPVLVFVAAPPDGFFIMGTGLVTIVVTAVVLVAIAANTTRARPGMTSGIIVTNLVCVLFLLNPVAFLLEFMAPYTTYGGELLALAISPLFAWEFALRMGPAAESGGLSPFAYMVCVWLLQLTFAGVLFAATYDNRRFVTGYARWKTDLPRSD